MPTEAPIEVPTEAPTIAPLATPSQLPPPSLEPATEPPDDAVPANASTVRLRVIDQPSSLGLADSILDSVASRYFGH